MSDELRQEVSAKIKDAYYHARDNGGTMHTAADDAADALLPVVERRVAQAEERWEDWSNDLADFVPDSYDDDVAQEAIILRWVEDMVERLADVERRIAQARAETAESIAVAIEETVAEVPRDIEHEPRLERGHRYGEVEGFHRAARIARQHAEEVGSGE